MSTLTGLNIGGSTYVPSFNPTFVAQPDPRNAALAFLLSLLLPGLGQFYCRKKSRGAWTMIFFLISLGVTIWLTPMLVGEAGAGIAQIWGVLLRIAVFLYGFAFLDAYFTAREMTVGTDPFIAESPRIAAILNLLTRGFGYFYLGQRAAGFAVFIGLGIFQQAIVHSLSAGNEAVGPLLLELILAALGVHAYQIARKREKEILATIEPAPQLPARRSLPPAVPVGLAILLAAAYVGLCCIGLFMPNYSAIDQSHAHISPRPQETVYSNPAYGIEFKAPPGWSLTDQDTKFLVSARRDDNVCAADLRLVAWSPILPADSYARAISAQLERPENKANRLVQNTPTTLGGLSVRDIVIAIEQQGNHVTEHQIAARKGMTLYILTKDSLTETGADCQSDFQYIQEHLTLPK
jgi:TM2 domain-containing membrane protein YozV